MWSTPDTRPIYPRDREPVPIVQEAGQVPGMVWSGAENVKCLYNYYNLFFTLPIDTYQIDSLRASGNSSLFQMEIISLWIAKRIVLPPTLIISAGI